MNPLMQRLQIALQVCFIVLPRNAIHPGRGSALERQKRFPQQINADMVQQRGELLFLPQPCNFPYTIQPL